MGCSAPSFSKPSTVMISAPSAWTANMVHDFTAAPFMRTVQAPQYVVSQPTCVPVRSRFSRSSSTSKSLGSTLSERTFPLTFTVMATFSTVSGINVTDLDLFSPRAPDSNFDLAFHQRACQHSFIFRRSPHIGLRIGCSLRCFHGGCDCLVIYRLAFQRRLSIFGFNR